MDPTEQRAQKRAEQAQRRAEARAACHDCHDCPRPAPAGKTRCDECARKRAGLDRERRGEESAAILPPMTARAILGGLVMGVPLSELCAQYEISPQRIYAHRVYDPEWGTALDDAMLRGRDEDLEHGRAGTYRHRGCHCPECREAKAAAGHWRKK